VQDGAWRSLRLTPRRSGFSAALRSPCSIVHRPMPPIRFSSSVMTNIRQLKPLTTNEIAPATFSSVGKGSFTGRVPDPLAEGFRLRNIWKCR